MDEVYYKGHAGAVELEARMPSLATVESLAQITVTLDERLRFHDELRFYAALDDGERAMLRRIHRLLTSAPATRSERLAWDVRARGFIARLLRLGRARESGMAWSSQASRAERVLLLTTNGSYLELGAQHVGQRSYQYEPLPARRAQPQRGRAYARGLALGERPCFDGRMLSPARFVLVDAREDFAEPTRDGDTMLARALLDFEVARDLCTEVPGLDSELEVVALAEVVARLRLERGASSAELVQVDALDFEDGAHLHRVGASWVLQRAREVVRVNVGDERFVVGAPLCLYIAEHSSARLCATAPITVIHRSNR